MRIWLSLLVVAFLVQLSQAQSVVTLSEDRKQAWYTPSGMSVGILADRIIRLTGDSPLPPVDPPIDPPIDPPTNPDEWGLIALSESAAKTAEGDPNYRDTAAKLSVAYVALGKQYQDGKIKQDEIKAFLHFTFQFVTGDSEDWWKPWQSATQAKYNSSTFEDVQEASQGVIDIGIGVGRTSNAAIGDFLKRLLEFFEFLRKLIDGFGAAELDVLLSAGAE